MDYLANDDKSVYLDEFVKKKTKIIRLYLNNTFLYKL